MFLNSGFFKVKALQQAHYSSSNCCVHVCTTIFTLWRISPMLNVLSSGKQRDITTTLMVRAIVLWSC
jgi:hypothetical protein